MAEYEDEIESNESKESADIEKYQLLIIEYFSKGEFENSISACKRALSLSTGVFEQAVILHHKGMVEASLNRKQQALASYERSLCLILQEKGREDAIYLNYLGMNYYELSLLFNEDEKEVAYSGKALETLEKLVQKHPDYEENPLVYAYLADLYVRSNNSEAAIDNYNKSIATARTLQEKVGFLVGLACVYRGQENFTESEKIFKEALSRAKEKRFLSKTFFEYGRMYFEWNQTKDAMNAFKRALQFLEFDPHLRNNTEYKADIFWHLGIISYNDHKYNKALEYLRNTLEAIDDRHPFYCNTLITMAHSYLAKENYDEAEAFYCKSLLAPLATDEERDLANQYLKRIEEERNI